MAPGAAQGAALFAQTKQELESMDYWDALGPESVPLVRKLLGDVVLTTESHLALHARVEALEQQAAALSAEAEALRRENARLVRENNELHLEMIRTAEELDAKDRAQQLHVRSAADRVAEARFDAEALRRALKQREEDIEAMRHGVNIDITYPPRGSSRAVAARAARDAATIEALERRLAEALAEASEGRAEADAASCKLELRDAEVARLGRELVRREAAPEAAAAAPHSAAQRRADKTARSSIGQAGQLSVQLYDHIDLLSSQLAEEKKTTSAQARTIETMRGMLAKAERELAAKQRELSVALTEFGRLTSAC
jgi:hypothetical protein